MIRRVLRRLLSRFNARLEMESIRLNAAVTSLDARLQNIERAVDVLVDFPEYIEGEGTEFNSQEGRRLIFSQIVQRIPFDAIVETGTYVGCTCAYMSIASGLPVYSCESNKRFSSLARRRLRELSGISIENVKSVPFIGALSRGALALKTVFFYLDAHWEHELPLVEEIRTISRGWQGFVIMVDDFEVPFDPEYGFDDYGEGGRLCLDLLAKTVDSNGLHVFFPSISARDETGAKRGCVVLTGTDAVARDLEGLSSLRRHCARAPLGAGRQLELSGPQ